MENWKGKKGTLKFWRVKNSRKQLVSLWLGAEGGSWGSWNLVVWRKLDLRPPKGECCRLGPELQELGGGAPSTHFPQTSDPDF